MNDGEKVEAEKTNKRTSSVRDAVINEDTKEQETTRVEEIEKYHDYVISDEEKALFSDFEQHKNDVVVFSKELVDTRIADILKKQLESADLGRVHRNVIEPCLEKRNEKLPQKKFTSKSVNSQSSIDNMEEGNTIRKSLDRDLEAHMKCIRFT